MQNISTYKPPPKHISTSHGSFIDWITHYESLVVFGGMFAVIIVTIILTGIFQAGPVVRENVIYNAFGAIFMAGSFIYIILKFMGSSINVMGKKLDIGMIIYLLIVLFVAFVFGN